MHTTTHTHSTITHRLEDRWFQGADTDTHTHVEAEYAGDGFKYRSWEGHMELPELNVENPDVRDYLFKVACC